MFHNKNNVNKDTNKKTSIELQPLTSPLMKIPQDLLTTICSFLDLKSLTKLSQVNSIFFNYCKNDKLWEKHVKELLTENPHRKPSESYYQFFYRFKDHVIKLKNLLTQKTATSDQILELLYEMAEAGLDRAFNAILTHYPDLKIQDYVNAKKLNSTLVHAAVKSNNTIILNQLIESGVSLTKRCDGFIYNYSIPLQVNIGLTPLHLAAVHGADECMEILLSSNEVEINSIDHGRNFTPLHWASEKGHINCVKRLIEKGADLTARDNNRDTPYNLAFDNYHKDCAEYIANKMREKNITVPDYWHVSEYWICRIQ